MAPADSFWRSRILSARVMDLGLITSERYVCKPVGQRLQAGSTELDPSSLAISGSFVAGCFSQSTRSVRAPSRPGLSFRGNKRGECANAPPLLGPEIGHARRLVGPRIRSSWRSEAMTSLLSV